MRTWSLAAKASRLAVFILLAAFCLPALAGVLYVPVSPTVVAQTADPQGLSRKVSEAPFGNFRTQSHPGGDCGNPDNALTCAAPYTFTGHLYDQESGLYYFGARYYDPETGRFLSQDPVAGDALNPPSLHKYLYAYSSPMNYTDPWGERVFDENDKPVWMEQEDIEHLNPGQVDTIRNIRNAVKVGYGQHGKYYRLLTEDIQDAAKKFNMAALFDGDPSQKEYLRTMVGAYQTAFGKEAEQDVRGYTVHRGAIESAPITWEDRAEAMRGAAAAMGEFVYSNTPLSIPEKLVEQFGEVDRRAHQVATLGWGKAWEQWTVEDKAQRDATVKSVDDFVNLRTAQGAWQNATSGNYEAGNAWGGAVIGGEFAALGVGASGIGTMRGAPGLLEDVEGIGLGERAAAERAPRSLGAAAADDPIFSGRKGVGSVSSKQTGSYTIEFESGKIYDGKGPLSRALESAREKTAAYGDKVLHVDWEPAPTTAEAFKAEALRIRSHGGIANPNTYNKINSPGERLLIKEGK